MTLTVEARNNLHLGKVSTVEEDTVGGELNSDVVGKWKLNWRSYSMGRINDGGAYNTFSALHRSTADAIFSAPLPPQYHPSIPIRRH